jgi:hypothetical protein
MSKDREMMIGGIMDVVTDRLPKLIQELMKTFYSEEAGTQIGKAVGAFYKELVNSGIPEEDAVSMAEDYLDMVKRLVMQNQPVQHTTVV